MVRRTPQCCGTVLCRANCVCSVSTLSIGIWRGADGISIRVREFCTEQPPRKRVKLFIHLIASSLAAFTCITLTCTTFGSLTFAEPPEPFIPPVNYDCVVAVISPCLDGIPADICCQVEGQWNCCSGVVLSGGSCAHILDPAYAGGGFHLRDWRKVDCLKRFQLPVCPDDPWDGCELGPVQLLSSGTGWVLKPDSFACFP